MSGQSPYHHVPESHFSSGYLSDEESTNCAQLQRLSRKMAELTDRISHQEQRLDTVEAEVHDQTDVVATLRASATRVNRNLDRLVDRMKRDQRLSDLTIRGVPLSGREKYAELESTVHKLGEHIGCPLTDRDIERVRRFESRTDGTKKCTMIVRFATTGLKKIFFSKYLEVEGGLRTSVFGCPRAERIYCGDNLTPSQAAIRRRAAELVGAGRLARFTVRSGLVYVWQVGEERRRAVHSGEELEELVAIPVDL